MRRISALTATTAVALGSVLAVPGQGTATPTGRTKAANPVLVWNEDTLAVLKAAGTHNLVQARVLAVVHAAIYEAVNAIAGSHQPYAAEVPAPAGASPDAAAAAAAHATLSRLYPAQAATLDAAYADSLAAVPDGTPETAGVEVGRAAAAMILTLRQDDGADTTGAYTPNTGPGYWQPTPPTSAPAALPAFRDVQLWTLSAADQFRPQAPYRLNSTQYAKDFNDVKTLGAATGSTRTADQTEVANFWYEPSQIGWNRIARLVATAHGTDTATAARLFALLNMTGMDSYVAGWDAKFTYESWRPVTAIRQAATDDNDATTADPAWEPLLVTPAHPDHVSTHGAWSGAASTVLAAFYGDREHFSFESGTAAGVTRSFNSFTQASHENVASRTYAGVHFPNANTTGEKLGTRIAEHALQRHLRPSSGARRAAPVAAVPVGGVQADGAHPGDGAARAVWPWLFGAGAASVGMLVIAGRRRVRGS